MSRQNKKECSIVINGKEIVFDLIRSNRKSIQIRVDPKLGISVRAPFLIPYFSIESFVRTKGEWILKQLDTISDNSYLPEFTGNHLDKLLFKGKVKEFHIISSSSSRVVDEPNRIAFYSSKKLSVEDIYRKMDKWYRLQALEYIESRWILQKKKIEPYLKITPAPFKLRLMKRFWGSCSSEGIITLNLKLVKAPVECVDFLICHELAHLVFHNHSKEYYSLLTELFPEWKDVKKSLNYIVDIRAPLL